MIVSDDQRRHLEAVPDLSEETAVEVRYPSSTDFLGEVDPDLIPIILFPGGVTLRRALSDLHLVTDADE